MDCICSLKQSCLGVVLSSLSSFYLLTPTALTEIDINTLHVKTRILTAQEYTVDNNYSLQLYQDNLYIFCNTPEYKIYGLDPPEFLKSVLCSGKKPYIPYSAIIGRDLIIFSTLSHYNIYLFNITQINTLGQIKRPIKLKLPSKVLVNMLLLHPEENLLIGACSDGALRV